MDELKIILPIVFLLVIIIAQNIWLADSITDFWKLEAKVHDAELKVLKTSKERLDVHMEALNSIADSQLKLANMIILLHGKEQNAGQSRCRQDFGNKTDASVTESGSDGRKEN